MKNETDPHDSLGRSNYSQNFLSYFFSISLCTYLNPSYLLVYNNLCDFFNKVYRNIYSLPKVMFINSTVLNVYRLLCSLINLISNVYREYTHWRVNKKCVINHVLRGGDPNFYSWIQSILYGFPLKYTRNVIRPKMASREGWHQYIVYTWREALT